jgi:hypothetical protein
MWSAGSCKFGPKLKWTGLDEVILEGRADVPVYLVIRHGEQGPRIAFEPAGDLLGLTCHEKILWLRDRYADAHFAAIGPAGEHYEDCYMASVALSTKTSSVGRRQVPMGRPRHGRRHGIQRVLAIVAQAPDRIAKLKPEIRDINKAASTGPGSRKFREKDKGGARRDLVELRAAREVPLRPPEQLPAHGRRQARADVPRARPAAVRRQGRVVLSLRHQLPQERVREERRRDARRLPRQVRLRAVEPAVDQYRDSRSAQGCHAHQPGRPARDGQHLAGHDDLVRDGLQSDIRTRGS